MLSDPITFLSLFSGIGGLDLGLERAGWKCVGQVEIDPYCRRVLAKHWPDVPKWDDVRTFTGDGFERPDAIVGGFPCQDLSFAGSRKGLSGERSGLWFEFGRIIRILRPRIVVVENVPGVLAPITRGEPAPIGRMLGELATLGYDAEWESIPAAYFGSPHIMDRTFMVANLDRQFWRARRARGCFGAASRLRLPQESRESNDEAATGSGHWEHEPNVGRLVHGIPVAVDRLRGLGNAVVPQVAEWIGRQINASIAAAHLTTAPAIATL